MLCYRPLLLAVLPAVALASRLNFLHGREEPGTKDPSPSMLVKASRTGNEVTFVMESQEPHFGYMAIGFGNKMTDTPMVIAWTHDNKVVLSQRKTPEYEPPEVDPNPPRLARVDVKRTEILAAKPKIAFTVPWPDAPGIIELIYASSHDNPGSSNTSAPIRYHNDKGVISNFTIS